MSKWLAESIDECSDPYDKARFEAGYAVVKSPSKPDAAVSDDPAQSPNL